MNFLGHLYFSNNDIELMHANLFGDFVKGSDLSRFSEKIQNGIRLHRNIDQYIDHHPEVLKLMHILYPHLPKVTGLAIDLFFDHLLAANWQDFHAKSLKDFLQDFYSYTIANDPEYSSEYKQFTQILKEKDWISHYPTRFGLERMCEGVSSRISFKNELVKAPLIFDSHKEIIESTFQLFMADAIPHFKRLYPIN